VVFEPGAVTDAQLAAGKHGLDFVSENAWFGWRRYDSVARLHSSGYVARGTRASPLLRYKIQLIGRTTGELPERRRGAAEPGFLAGYAGKLNMNRA